MVQIIDRQPDFKGRLGKAIGQSLGENIPKEIERQRLSHGLNELGKNSGNLSPFERFAQLSSIPGVTPQMIQSGSELLRQEGKAKSLSKFGASDKSSEVSKPNTFPTAPKGKSSTYEKSPSLTESKGIEESLQGYIPPTQQQKIERAAELYNENPAFFENDANKAISYVDQEVAQEQNRNQSYQNQRANQLKEHDIVTSALRNHANSLGVQIPANVYDKIEDEAIENVTPKSKGGKGMTETEAKKLSGKKLDEISREYKDIDNVGNWSVLSRTPSESNRLLKSLEDKFYKRNDTENLADSLVANNGLSWSKAYYVAEPVKRIKELNNAIAKIPPLKNEVKYDKGFPDQTLTSDLKSEKTLEISKKLAPLLGDRGSPLAVAEELRMRNYDPQVWLDYLDEHKDDPDINLRGSQSRQLTKPLNLIPNLNDIWLFMFSGQDKVVEQ